ncbi:Hsp20/alpha crystallin family protein [Algibacter sp. 2305UL17-15]|uniref:Hsp20/alpha crystallin family protein n=1 Tax=Algibacter sp. 2305UL17-15 TaxID=3231268 RepID=UPI00345A7AF2
MLPDNPIEKPNKVRSYRFSRYFNRSISDPYLDKRTHPSDVKVTETKSSFHFELKLPGYIKEDFNFYVCSDDLVVTTERSNIKEMCTKESGANENDTHQRHSYCYPSAYFKRRFPLPENIVRDKISVDYKNGILSFELLKSVSR